jgi:hypothetical protein
MLHIVMYFWLYYSPAKMRHQVAADNACVIACTSLAMRRLIVKRGNLHAP